MTATAQQVREVLAQVTAGTLTPAAAGTRLKAMNLPEQKKMAWNDVLAEADSTFDPASIEAVAAEEAIGNLTREQGQAIRAAYRA